MLGVLTQTDKSQLPPAREMLAREAERYYQGQVRFPDRNQVTVVMDWDGKQITGVLNPGPGAIPILKASLEPKGWLVHFEADAKNAAGRTVHYIVDGHIENLGLYNRSIVGTWSHDNVKGDFKITRQ